MQILLRYNQRSGLSTQHIINVRYNQRLFTLFELTTKYEANAWVAVGVRCVHFSFCNHNIRGSGLKGKKSLVLIA
jgi:hypothetical protein